MSRLFASDTFDLDNMSDSDEDSGNEEGYFFRVIGEDDDDGISDIGTSNIGTSDIGTSDIGTSDIGTSDNRKSDYVMTSGESSSSTNETPYSNHISPLNQFEVNYIFSSIVDDNEEHQPEFESPLEVIMDPNSSIITPKEKSIETEKAGNVFVVVDNIDISSDSNENTEQPETIQTSQIIDLSSVYLLKKPGTVFNLFYYKTLFVELNAFLSNKSENYIVKSFIKTSKTISGYDLHISDLMTLVTPRAWLNDSVVQNYISLVVKYCDKTFELNTDFLVCFSLYGYQSASKWFIQYDLNNFNRIVLPINPNRNHWALLVIEIWERKIYYFDSYITKNIEKELKLASNFFNQLLTNHIKSSVVKRSIPKYWTYIDGNSPIQSNNYDCGIYTCLNARIFLLKRSLKFARKDIIIIRQVIAWELINNALESF